MEKTRPTASDESASPLSLLKRRRFNPPDTERYPFVPVVSVADVLYSHTESSAFMGGISVRCGLFFRKSKIDFPMRQHQNARTRGICPTVPRLQT